MSNEIEFQGLEDHLHSDYEKRFRTAKDKVATHASADDGPRFPGLTQERVASAEFVYAYPAEQVYSVVKRYDDFLDVLCTSTFTEAKIPTGKPSPWTKFTCISEPKLKTNQDGIEDGVQGYEYLLEWSGKIYAVTEVVTIESKPSEDSPNYVIGTSYLDTTVPKSSLFKGMKNLFEISKYDETGESCVLKWSKKFRSSYLGGDKAQRTWETRMLRQLDTIRQLFHIRYSPKLPKKNSRVAIVGAGPSGIHMAHVLVSRGLPAENITIFEKTNRIGGKSVSRPDQTNKLLKNPVFNEPKKVCCGADIPGGELVSYEEDGETIYHELGTCYLSPAYFTVRALLRDLQQKTAVLDNAAELPKIDREVASKGYSIESKDYDSIGLDEWMYESGKNLTILDNLLGCTKTGRRLGFSAGLILAKMKYCKLQEHYFGKYYYRLPPQPRVEYIEELTMTFEAFIEQHDLEIMTPIFKYLLSVQGYGMLNQTPTFIAMQWITTELLDGIFEWQLLFDGSKASRKYVKAMKELGSDIQLFNHSPKTMLVSGFESIWKRIVAIHQLEERIIYECDVRQIKRSESNVFIDFVKKGESQVTQEFDYLVVAAPMSDAFYKPTEKTLPMDLNLTEEDIFLNPDLKASSFRTTVFKPERNGKHSHNHLRAFVDTLDKNGGHGEVYAIRDSYKANQPRLSTLIGDSTDPYGKQDTPREKMTYQIVAPRPFGKVAEMSSEYLTSRMEAFFKSQKGFESSKVVSYEQWTYFTHFADKAMQQGKLWQILDLQGSNNTLFVHASSSFESILDITNYNNMLISGLSGELETLVKPRNSFKPEPWMRPQQFMASANFTTWFWIVEWIGHRISLCFWILLYILFTPIFYLTRRRRRMRYREGTTPGLKSEGSCGWTGYSFKQFVETSSFVQIMEGNKDPISDFLSGESSDFYQQFPGSKGDGAPLNALEMSFQDLRKGLQYMFTSESGKKELNLNQVPWISPVSKAIVDFLSGYMPNYYSWMFSFILGLQFRYLWGFSYRFNDLKGGGLYVPHCNKLAGWTKKYGTNAGRRLCQTSCKVFNEELFRSKGVPIEFSPDFLDQDAAGRGSGFGCEIRLHQYRQNAYTSHESYKTPPNTSKLKLSQFDW